MQVIPSGKYLTEEAIRDKMLSDLVDLLWFLRLTSPVSEEHIRVNIEVHAALAPCRFPLLGSFFKSPDHSLVAALESDQTQLLGMLQVITMALRNLAVHCLLYPADLINQPVPIVLHHL